MIKIQFQVSSVIVFTVVLYYLSILDVMTRLSLVLVWAWYVLLTDCTIVLSPVYLYWHYLSKINDAYDFISESYSDREQNDTI